MRLTIHGRVQGVGYRAWATRQASLLGLQGWVRNRSNGTVEVLAYGSEAALSAFELLCGRGPSAASVIYVARAQDDEVAEAGFLQLPTV